MMLEMKNGPAVSLPQERNGLEMEEISDVTDEQQVTNQKIREQATREMAQLGYTMSDEQLLRLLRLETKNVMFRHIKFISNDGMIVKMEKRFALALNIDPSEMANVSSRWWDVWHNKGMSAVRQSINKRRGEVNMHIKDRFLSK